MLIKNIYTEYIIHSFSYYWHRYWKGLSYFNFIIYSIIIYLIIIHNIVINYIFWTTDYLGTVVVLKLLKVKVSKFTKIIFFQE